MEGTPIRFVNINDEGTMLALFEELKHGTFEYVAFDTETTGLDRYAQIFGFSITLGDPRDKEKFGKTYWYRFSDYIIGDVDEQRCRLDDFAEEILGWLFTESTKRIIMHHAAFDIRLVRQTFGFEFAPNVPLNDTMLMSQCLRKTSFHGLKPLGQYYLKHFTDEAQAIEEWFRKNKIKKADRNYADVPDELMFPYACADAELTYSLFFKMREAFATVKKSVQSIYVLEREVVPVTAEMEYNGMVVSVPYFTEMKAELEGLQAELREKIPVENPNSSQQIGKWLFGKPERGGLGLVPHAFTETGQPKVDAKTLERYRDNPLIADYMLYNKVAHILGTFVNGILENCVEREDGNFTIHTNYNQIIATGRYSSKAVNLQNMPNDSFSRSHGKTTGADLSIRRGFICPENYVYAKLDYSAFELRLIGNASGDSKFNEMILDGVDMHSWLAMQLYSSELDKLNEQSEGELAQKFSVGHEELNQKWGLGWKYWAVKSKSTEDFKYMRTMVKICSFQVYYGSGPRTISRMHGISERDAARLREICFSSFMRVAQWRNEVVAYGQQHLAIYTLFGRKCVLHPNKVYTESVNYTIQGTAADILKAAMVDIYKLLAGTRSRIVATIHDEVQVYIHKDELHLLPRLIECMEKERMPADKYPLPMLCELSLTTTNWAEMRDVNHLTEDVITVAREMLNAT